MHMVQCIVNLGNYLREYETLLLSYVIFLMYAMTDGMRMIIKLH
jgi:hypothetical protein